MDTATAKKKEKKDHRQLILEGFVSHVLEHGKEPASIFKFAKDLKIKEAEFYNYFTSFDAIKSAIWVALFEETDAAIEKSVNLAFDLMGKSALDSLSLIHI